MSILTTVAGLFGINVFRLVMYGAITTAVAGGALWLRHHEVEIGVTQTLAKVAKQNAATAAAAAKIQKETDACKADSYWDVVTKECELGDDK